MHNNYRSYLHEEGEKEREQREEQQQQVVEVIQRKPMMNRGIR